MVTLSAKLLSSQGMSRELIWKDHVLNKFLGAQDIYRWMKYFQGIQNLHLEQRYLNFSNAPNCLEILLGQSPCTGVQEVGIGLRVCLLGPRKEEMLLGNTSRITILKLKQ